MSRILGLISSERSFIKNIRVLGKIREEKCVYQHMFWSVCTTYSALSGQSTATAHSGPMMDIDYSEYTSMLTSLVIRYMNCEINYRHNSRMSTDWC